MAGSFGAEKSTNTGKFSNTTTDTLDKQLSDTLYGFYNETKNLPGYQPISGPLVAGFNTDQLNAQDLTRQAAGAGIGQDWLKQAAGAAGSVAGYQPMAVDGTYNPAGAGTAQIDRGQIRDIGNTNVNQADIQRFMNPYEDTVVNSALSDLDRQRARAQADNSAYATKAGAFRGTGLFGLRDRTDETFARQAGDTAGGLRYQGWNSATSNAQQDANRGLQGQLANQGQDASVQSQNAGWRQQSALDAAARADAAKQFGIGAQQFNVNAANAAQGLKLQGAGALGNLSQLLRDNTYGDIAALGGVGDAGYNLTQAGIDAKKTENDKVYGSQMDKFNAMLASLGLIPQTGTRTTSGTESSKSKGTSMGVSAAYPGGGK